MALISCPSCGKEISDKALTCPGCGYNLSDLHKEEKPKPVICEECGAEIPENAAVCPNCGCPISTVMQKKNSDTIIKVPTHPDAIYCYKKGFQNLYVRCSCGCEFKYMNTFYKRTILNNGDYKFDGGLPIMCPQCRAIYDTISFTPVENISTKHVDQYRTEIIECSACKGKISNKARVCPHCGQPTNRCPVCGSADIVKIGGLSKGASVWAVGAFASNTVLNDFQCKKCGNKFK